MTCSMQGLCVINATTPICQCFPGYSGLNCEIMSQKIKTAKSVGNIAAFVSIAFILSFLGLMIFSDITKYYFYLHIIATT